MKMIRIAGCALMIVAGLTGFIFSYKYDVNNSMWREGILSFAILGFSIYLFGTEEKD